MLFIISNSKLGIWICIQPRIDLNSQYNFYYVLNRPYKYLSNTLPTLSTRTTCTQYNLHVSFTILYKTVLPINPTESRQAFQPLILYLIVFWVFGTKLICNTNTSNMSVPTMQWCTNLRKTRVSTLTSLILTLVILDCFCMFRFIKLNEVALVFLHDSELCN